MFTDAKLKEIDATIKTKERLAAHGIIGDIIVDILKCEKHVKSREIEELEDDADLELLVEDYPEICSEIAIKLRDIAPNVATMIDDELNRDDD